MFLITSSSLFLMDFYHLYQTFYSQACWPASSNFQPVFILFETEDIKLCSWVRGNNEITTAEEKKIMNKKLFCNNSRKAREKRVSSWNIEENNKNELSKNIAIDNQTPEIIFDELSHHCPKSLKIKGAAQGWKEKIIIILALCKKWKLLAAPCPDPPLLAWEYGWQRGPLGHPHPLMFPPSHSHPHLHVREWIFPHPSPTGERGPLGPHSP